MFLVVFIGLFYAVGFGLLGYGLWSMYRSNAAGGWPTVPGKVASCSIETRTDGEGDTTYQVQVAYTYHVAGIDYTGDRLTRERQVARTPTQLHGDC